MLNDRELNATDVIPRPNVDLRHAARLTIAERLPAPDILPIIAMLGLFPKDDPR
jgi:hypothetical protein